MTITVGGTSITFNDATTQSTAAVNATTANVLAATAGATAGAVGSYAFLWASTSADYAPGATLAGSSLRYSGIGSSSSNDYNSASNLSAGQTTILRATAPAGTWRCMGASGYTTINTELATASTLWLRIS